MQPPSSSRKHQQKKPVNEEEQMQLDIKAVKSGRLPDRFAERLIELENKLSSNEYKNDDSKLIATFQELMGLYSVSKLLN